MSYAASQADMHRLTGTYVGHILKEEKPGELPILQPTKFGLAINLTKAGFTGVGAHHALVAPALSNLVGLYDHRRSGPPSH